MSTTEQPQMSPEELCEHWRTNPPPWLSVETSVPYEGDLDHALEVFRETAELVLAGAEAIELRLEVKAA